MNNDLVVPTSLVAGFGISKFYTNIREFTDENQANHAIQNILHMAHGFDPDSSPDEYSWLRWLLSPYCNKPGGLDNAETISRVHLEGRGKPASFAFDAFFVKEGSDTNYTLVVKDAESFLAKKALKGLVSIHEGKSFMDPPEVKTIKVSSDDRMRSVFEELLTYMQDSGRAHRRKIAENISRAMNFQLNNRWKGRAVA